MTCEVFVDGVGAAWDSVLAFLVGTASCCSCLGAGAGSAFTETWVASKKCISSPTPIDEWYLQAAAECQPDGNMQMDQQMHCKVDSRAYPGHCCSKCSHTAFVPASVHGATWLQIKLCVGLDTLTTQHNLDRE